MYEKLWLAGLGAYRRSEKLGKEGKKLFDELVCEGDDMRDEISDRFESMRKKTLDKINSTISKVKQTVKLESKNTEDEATTLNAQLEALTKAVYLLVELQKNNQVQTIETQSSNIVEQKATDNQKLKVKIDKQKVTSTT